MKGGGGKGGGGKGGRRGKRRRRRRRGGVSVSSSYSLPTSIQHGGLIDRRQNRGKSLSPIRCMHCRCTAGYEMVWSFRATKFRLYYFHVVFSQ